LSASRTFLGNLSESAPSLVRIMTPAYGVAKSGMIRRSPVDSRKGSKGIRDAINSAPVILPTSQRSPTPSPGYRRMTNPYRSLGFLPRGGVSVGPLALWRGSPEPQFLAPDMSRGKW